ncbi:MHC class I polypeptide-related sequence A [Ctenodactylus gundi]
MATTVQHFQEAVPCVVSSSPGSHRLCYNLTVNSRDGFVHTRVLAQGHLDGELFLHYDSDKGQAEPRGPWAEASLGPETWDRETRDLEESGKTLRMTMADINALQGHTGGDNHPRATWDLSYDWEPFLSYCPENHSWTVLPSSAHNLALKVKKSWDEDGIHSKARWAHILGELYERLPTFVSSWVKFKTRTVSPAVNVALSEASGDTLNLTCAASGFFPPNITVTWLQDGEPLSQNTQQSMGVLSSGNGTFRTWVYTGVSQGQEQRFSCLVEHSGNRSTHPVPFRSAHGPTFPIEVGAVPAAVVLFVGMIALVLWIKKKRSSLAAQDTDESSAQARPGARPLRQPHPLQLVRLGLPHLQPCLVTQMAIPAVVNS